LIPRLAIPGIGFDAQLDRELLVYAVGYAAIVGHVFPVWFEFRGGKGGATAAGLLFYFAPPLAAPVIVVWLAVIFFTGYVGIATVSAAVLTAVYIGVTGMREQHAFFIFASLVALLIVYTHRGNLRRTLAGTESRFGRYFGLKNRA
jgi:glycerol-3-phosphate acyltransferase PlsY